MKRFWKKTSDLVFQKSYSTKPQNVPVISTLKTVAPSCRTPGSVPAHLIREFTTQRNSSSSQLPNIAALFLEKWSSADDSMTKKYLTDQVSVLKGELLENSSDADNVKRVLEEKGVPLFRRYSDSSAVVELLKQLASSPDLALQIFNWRREQVDYQAPMIVEEYAMGITEAGRRKDVDMAAELFAEAANKSLKTTSLYNALMGAYTINGMAAKCQTTFRALKQEATCSPTIGTYNILIAVCARLMLVDHMEATFREIKDLNLSPDERTYNSLLCGYVTAWMWDKMEKTYMIMKAGDVKPNLATHLLMLRGYAHSGKLEKMEEIYQLVENHVNHKEIHLIRAMIRAYGRSSVSNRVEKIEELLKLIPENDYRPWLNVFLICVYANENLLVEMENYITEAFEHKTAVRTVSAMRCIIASYFRNGTVEKLTNFVKRAESSGWKICRSLYHCKMVMYASQRRLTEMEKVLDEMNKVKLNFSKRTFWILYKAYWRWGQKNKVKQVLGMMCKHGHTIPLDAYFP